MELLILILLAFSVYWCGRYREKQITRMDLRKLENLQKEIAELRVQLDLVDNKLKEELSKFEAQIWWNKRAELNIKIANRLDEKF